MFGHKDMLQQERENLRKRVKEKEWSLGIKYLRWFRQTKLNLQQKKMKDHTKRRVLRS